MWYQCCNINQFLFPHDYLSPRLPSCDPSPHSQPLCHLDSPTCSSNQCLISLLFLLWQKDREKGLGMGDSCVLRFFTPFGCKYTAFNTIVTGSCHSTNCISGNEITLTQFRVSVPHVVNQLLNSRLLLSTTQRHALSTHNVDNVKATRSGMCWGWLTDALPHQWTNWCVRVQPCLDFSSLDHVVDSTDTFINTNQLQ